ncbi:unnamed protein product [Ranitomeya imitator]|uniref:Reverse transcriptase n=1 Tax=Ranitomeya imitator TaxID=111125 RepID=A0ABN9LYH9_9NEOB|nr:unnamed protein product [Ranitomeya imitator]
MSPSIIVKSACMIEGSAVFSKHVIHFFFQDDYMEALARLHLTVTSAYKVNPDINFEVFIHKVDGLSDDHKIETQRDIHQRANDDLSDAGLEKIHLSFYLTSIYDHSIFEAFSKVVQKLIPQLPTLENLLNIFISNSGIEKAFLFDVVSKIYIATDSAPVDMQTYELCCDMIDVVIDISSIYGLKGAGTPYDKESLAIIRLNNTTVLYLKEVTKFLALVCFVREESFERKGDPALRDVDAFSLALGLLYDEPNSVDQAEKILLALCQGQDEAEVYCQKFRKWSVLTQWNECALAAVFIKGLSEALKDVMVGFPTPAGLNESMSLAIQIDRRLRERKAVHHLAVFSEHRPEPMQCDRTLTRAERQEHRRRNGLCFYCGDSTHAISDCPKRTKRFARSATIGTVQSKFLLSVTLICSLSSYSIMAFVDSGAALNLMDLEFARHCGFFLEPLQYPIPLRGIDATPLAKNKPQYWTQLTMCMAPAHQEDIRFLVLHNLHDVVVLGLPWLQVHNPVLDWKSMSVSGWGCRGVHGDVLLLSISPSTPSEVPEFLSDYRDVFDEPKSSALPPHRDCDCAINLIPGSKFPKGRLFNLSVPEHAAMRSYIKESLEKGHIRPSSSPLGAGFFFVAKKDGSLRPCIDYRLLNKITVKFQYPLLLLSDLFARIKGASWFTKIDLRGAYNLVRIKQGDEWKTAFNTPEGHFEYLVMPFGLSNALSVFQSFMHDIFRKYLDRFMIVYLDDILVFSDDWESHVKQVRMVFQVLRANSLFVKGSKCLFGVQKVSFLGFIFSPSTIEMDPVKVQAIYDWTQPTSVKSLQKFLGFANFYRRFIANFFSVAKPLTDLTKKGADVVNWSSAAVEAFQELKRRFSSAPVLCQPDVSLPFQVEVDASEIGAGAALSQRSSDGSVMKPCAFFSRKFSPAERNYDVGNRELLAMKWAFEEWRHWLEGAKHRVVVLTDHKNLTYLESAKRLNPRHARWSLFFSRFDFVVSYLPGSKNVKADALSRSFVPDSPGVPEPAGILKEGHVVRLHGIPENIVSDRGSQFVSRSLLRRYVVPMVPSVDPPAPVLVEGELEYVVEKILDSRISRRKLQYLVKWKGYGQEDNSWVFVSDVHAADLVRAFHLARPDRPGGSGLIDYNFHCFRKAIQEVFEVRVKVLRSRKHLSHIRKSRRAAPNGAPRARK